VLAAVQAVDEVRDVALGPPDLDAPYGGKTLVGPEGAAPQRRVDVVFQHGTVIVVGGTVFGLGGAYLLSRALQNHLFGVGLLDPASYLGAAAFLGFVAAAACTLPARRAVHLDPVQTLREE
jgi:ABC-type lipoprotein release transport system permease subunit